MADRELEAMKSVAGALEPLTDEERERVLLWVGSRFSIGVGSRPRGTPQPQAASASASSAEWESLAEFFDAVDPQLERDKALTVAYWIQFKEMRAEFSSQDVNTRLKDLGHGVSNITEAFYQLQDERPARVLQLRKAGSSKQARKTYKVTEAGRKFLDTLLNRPREEE